MRKLSLLLCVLLFVLATGCVSSIVNPFKEDAGCPQGDKGQCMGVYEAYHASVNTTDEPIRKARKKADDDPPAQPPAPENLYQQELYNKMSGLIRDPRTPMLVPEKVVRGLFLPVEGEEDELYMEEYVYIKMDRSRFLLSPAAAR